MNTESIISSLQNAKVKNIVALQQKSSERRKQGAFVVEGVRELNHCLQAGYRPESLFYCPEIFSQNPEAENTGRIADRVPTYQVTRAVYEKMAYRDSTEGIIGLMRAKTKTRLTDLDLPNEPLIVVLESVEKPGNLGAVLRTADASKTDAVIVCDPLTDLFNPNLIRSSIGAIFTVPTVACSSEECITFLKAHNIKILTAQLQDSSPYFDTDMQGATAIVMGTEATGLTNIWREAANAHIHIPMLGKLDSLNVSVSAAILMFEAVRQRNG